MKKNVIQPYLNRVKESFKQRGNHISLLMLGLIVLLALAFIFSLSVGRYSIPPVQIWTIITARMLGGAQTWPTTVENVIFSMRLPRIIVAIIVGAALAGAGAAYQGLLKNPMVSPDILGASAGASFGAALAILLSFNAVGTEILSFTFGILAVAMTYALSSSIRNNISATLFIVLTGIVVGNLFTAFTSMVKFVADPNSKLPEITFWLMGGLAAVSQREVLMLLIPFIMGIVPLIMLRWRLNVMAFGDEEALALGLDTGKIRLVVILAATLVTSASVSVSGMVGWVGLIIPHLARLIVGPNYKALLPASMLIGSTFLLLVDNLARSIYTTEIPLSILTSIIGAPFFMYLLYQEKRSW